MADREIVRKALECIAEDRQKSCIGCEYSIFGLYPFCIHGIARDAIELLKEQETVDPTIDEYGEVFCGNYGESVGIVGKTTKIVVRMQYCPGCGKAVNWKMVK